MKKMLLHSFEKFPLLQETLQPHQVTDFCEQLEKSGEILDATCAVELLNLFCNKCWQLEEEQQSCYESISAVWKRGPIEAKIKLIPLLVKYSKLYNNFVFLALEFAKQLEPEECKKLERIDLVYWTGDNEYTSITKEEYDYRQKQNLECWYQTYTLNNGDETKDYRRPFKIDDIRCFEAMLCVINKSGQRAIFIV